MCWTLPPADQVSGFVEEQFDDILSKRVFAVTGVSRNPAKFGNIIYRYLQRAGYEVFAVNPNADRLEDEPCYDDLSSLPVLPDVVVTVTQPWVTVHTCKEVIELKIPYVWMQPGSESRDGIRALEENGTTCIHGGHCIMVEHRRLPPQ